MLGHIDLALYYKLMFALTNHFKYSVQDIEDMMPFERDLYVDMLLDFIEKQKENKT